MGDFRQMQFLRLAAAASLLLALVNHLLPPKAFAATQLLFDYQFGLIRRGLAGEVLGLLTGPQVSITEVYLATASLSMFGALAFYLFLQRFMPDQVSGYLLLILALNSFAYASFIGNTGYLDAALLGLTLLALSVDGNRGLVLRLLVVVVAMLLHENMLPYFALLIGFDTWLGFKDYKNRLLLALSPAVLGVVTLAVLIGFGGITADQATAFGDYLQSRAGFALDPNSTIVAGRTIAGNLALMAELRGTTKYWAWVMFDGVPLLLMSVWLIWLCNRVLGDAVSRQTRAWLILAVLAPLSLNIVAFDVVRFGVASVLAGFIAIALILRHDKEAAARLTAALSWPHFLLVLVLNVNIFTIEVNIGAGHTSQFPWVLLTQLKWLAP